MGDKNPKKLPKKKKVVIKPLAEAAVPAVPELSKKIGKAKKDKGM